MGDGASAGKSPVAMPIFSSCGGWSGNSGRAGLSPSRLEATSTARMSPVAVSTARWALRCWCRRRGPCVLDSLAAARELDAGAVRRPRGDQKAQEGPRARRHESATVIVRQACATPLAPRFRLASAPAERGKAGDRPAQPCHLGHAGDHVASPRSLGSVAFPWLDLPEWQAEQDLHHQADLKGIRRERLRPSGAQGLRPFPPRTVCRDGSPPAKDRSAPRRRICRLRGSDRTPPDRLRILLSRRTQADARLADLRREPGHVLVRPDRQRGAPLQRVRRRQRRSDRWRLPLATARTNGASMAHCRISGWPCGSGRGLACSWQALNLPESRRESRKPTSSATIPRESRKPISSATTPHEGEDGPSRVHIVLQPTAGEQ